MTAISSHRLADLCGHWIVDVNDRHVGIKFICPTCPQFEGAPTIAVLFENPSDGGPPAPLGSGLVGENAGKRWHRVSGDTIDTLTLTPSIDCSTCGHWHGMVDGGVAR